MKSKLVIPGVDTKLLIKDAVKEMPDPMRRRFLRGGASLGALVMLSGCNPFDAREANDFQQRAAKLLWKVSKFNDEVQARIFNPAKLAPELPAALIDKPFRFNAFYGEARAPVVDGTSYRLQLGGLIDSQAPWTLDQLYALPQFAQVTRHICIEGWSQIGRFTGARLSDFLKRVGADLTAKYVYFECAEGYYTSIDMASALHPQTQMTFRFGADDEILPVRHGFPMKIRLPTKLGFKNPKHVVKLVVTNDDMGGYWEDQGYNWFSGS